MTQQTARAETLTRDPRTNLTRSLLGCGVIAGPVYVATSLTQALTRDGFDLTRHAWSMLANGDLGWIQVTNFLATGLMIVACAAGLRRALIPGYGAVWAPRFVAVYGLSMVGAGTFRADPGMGFPAGTPEGPGPVSWHGMSHFAFGAVGFLCLTAACLVIGRRFAAAGRTGWALCSGTVGVLFFASFATLAAGGAAWTISAFIVGLVITFCWLSVLSFHLR
ncbi:DUF998 domain-containing protein [Streptosporangium sp. NPDC004379]|uniref:DUF998 domain-containing protein n=1 Tax=Streptosporangium sp. NPDC004379 TaxID=3366189 RepID=UPI0036C4DE45